MSRSHTSGDSDSGEQGGRPDRRPGVPRGGRAVLSDAGHPGKHLAGTERFWFSIDFADLDVTWPWPDDDLHGNFRSEPDDTLATIVASYVEECAHSRRAIVHADLDDSARGGDMDFTLRFVMLHMIEETARHCGHLDLLREAIDGSVGS